MVEPMNPMLDISAAASAPGINSDGGREHLDVGQKADGKMPVAKSLLDLVPGEVFTAEILDIQPGVVTLKIGEGTLAARTLAAPDARIGDKASFLVKENIPATQGGSAQIMLEFLRGGGSSLVSASIVKEALSAANMQLTRANSELIEQLVAHNLPIDNHSVQRAAFFRYSMPDAPFAQIAFLIENNFAPIDRTVEVFQGLLDGKLNIKQEVAGLRAAIEALGDGKLKETLTQMVKGKLALDVEFGQEPSKFLQQLRGLTEEIGNFLRTSGAQAQAQTAAVRQALANIGDIIDFASNISDTKLYYQFPFIIQQRENMAELHVMKRKGAKKAGAKNATALIALDMPHLGRIEVLVNKADRDVNLQFRSDSGLTLYAINGEGAKLAEMLGDKGFLLTGLGLKMLSEKFDITQGAEKKTKAAPTAPVPEGPKRYSFDMRV